MEINKLKEIVTNYEKDNTTSNDNYVPMLVIEQVLKKKNDELQEKLEEYRIHISRLLGKDCQIILSTNGIHIEYKKSVFSDKRKSISMSTFLVNKSDLADIMCYNEIGVYEPNTIVVSLLQKDTMTRQMLDYCYAWQKENTKLLMGLQTNIGLFIDINQSFEELKILFGDRNYNSEYNNEKPYPDDSLPKEFYYDYHTFIYKPTIMNGLKGYEDISNFYYMKNLLTDERKIVFSNPDTKEFINESLIGKIYSRLTVDISRFNKKLQDEIREKYESYRLNLNNEEEKEFNKLKQMQVDRIMEAYKKFKEIAELLNNSKMNIPLEKIKLDNLSTIFFKNNGIPNEEGFIEIDDFFKNNMLLRMLDLSNIDLTNVDIRNMDFSGTNIHIDPQIIYSKDMTNVNACGVKFSPFTDSFDDVILNGAIIDDWEAMINLDKLKSYDNRTVIPNQNLKAK